ncbi:unnamed protein product [Leuciscus chuanchicus]
MKAGAQPTPWEVWEGTILVVVGRMEGKEPSWWWWGGWRGRNHPGGGGEDGAEGTILVEVGRMEGKEPSWWRWGGWRGRDHPGGGGEDGGEGTILVEVGRMEGKELSWWRWGGWRGRNYPGGGGENGVKGPSWWRWGGWRGRNYPGGGGEDGGEGTILVEVGRMEVNTGISICKLRHVLSLLDNAIVGICDPTFTKPLKGFSPEAWVGKSGNKATASKHHACWRGVHGFSGRIGGSPRARGRRAHSPVGL